MKPVASSGKIQPIFNKFLPFLDHRPIRIRLLSVRINRLIEAQQRNKEEVFCSRVDTQHYAQISIMLQKFAALYYCTSNSGAGTHLPSGRPDVRSFPKGPHFVGDCSL